MKKHIVCFGDSNTHGCCADPTDCADGGNRFNEDERCGVHYLDAADCEFNPVDFTHLTRRGHSRLAAKLAELVPELLR